MPCMSKYSCGTAQRCFAIENISLFATKHGTIAEGFARKEGLTSKSTIFSPSLCAHSSKAVFKDIRFPSGRSDSKVTPAVVVADLLYAILRFFDKRAIIS